MGEMADYFLEEVEEMEVLRIKARHEEISQEELYDLGLIDEQGNEDF